MLRERSVARAQLPLAIRALLVAIIAAAAVLALAWPQLHAASAPTISQRVGMITREVARPEAVGRVGALAPDFQWIDPDGSTRSLGALRGRVVIVNFWATWCAPCRAEMPALERVAERRADVTILEVDLQEDATKVRAFFDALGVDALQPLIDIDGIVTRRFSVVSVPTTFFVDPTGIIRDIDVGGPMTEERIEQGIATAAAPPPR